MAPSTDPRAPARPASTTEAVSELVETVDAEVAGIAARLGERLRCGRGCSGCCTDGLGVGPAEAAWIVDRIGDALAGATPGPPTGCAFLDADGSCRIYPARPYVCRTQGLPLRWTEEEGRGEVVEHRDICPLNEPGPPLEGLPDADCWLLGPSEARLAELDREAGSTTRIPLRTLFETMRSSTRET